MLEILRKKTRKSLILTAVGSFLLAVVLLAVTKFAVFEVVTGAKELDITEDPAKLDGHYVTIDAECILADFVEHTTVTTRKYSSQKTTSVNGYSYIAFQSVPDYENDATTWYFYGIYMPKGKKGDFDTRMEETWNYLKDDTDTVAPPQPLKLTGTWSRMESDIERYFQRTLDEIGVEAGEYDVIYYYTLNTNEIGGLNQPLFWCLTIVSALSLIFGIYCAAGAFSSAYLSKINAYLRTQPSVSMDQIGNDFQQAHLVEKTNWVGRKWTIYIKSYKAQILENKDLVWGYYFRRTGRNSVSELRLFDVNKKRYCIGMTEKGAHEALEYYAAEQPQMIAGYSADLEKMFNKNFQGFLDLKYRPAKNGAYGQDN